MTANKEILARIYETLKPFENKVPSIHEKTEFVADIGLSSLQIMEMVEQLEDHFDVSIPLNILPDIRTVADLGKQLDRIINTRQ